jgi:hypothetical protein
MAGFAGEKGQGLGSQPARMVGGVEGRQWMARLPGRDVQDTQVFMSGRDHHALGLADEIGDAEILALWQIEKKKTAKRKKRSS